MSEGIISSSAITDSRLVGSTVGMVGYGCSMSTILISAYSPLLATPEISSPVTHGMTHALLFFAMACTYFVFFHFIKNCDRYMCSKKLQVIFLLLQLALPVVALVNNVAHFNVPIPLTATAWICFGVASGYFTCAWTAAQNGIAARRIRSVNIISFCIAACISLFVFCMPTMVELVSLIALCVISCGILMRAPHRGGEVINTDSSDWFEKSKFNKDGSYVMFVNGIMLGVFTGLLVARVSRDVLPIFSIGIAFVIVSIMFCVLAKTAPSYLSLDKAQLIFLPVVVAGAIVIGFLMRLLILSERIFSSLSCISLTTQTLRYYH